MELPEGFQKLLKDFDPRDLNKMPAAELIKLFSLAREMAECLEYYSLSSLIRNPITDDYYAETILKKFKEWK